MRAPLWRGDLARVAADLEPERAARAARMLGFEAPPELPDAPPPISVVIEPPSAKPVLPAQAPKAKVVPAPPPREPPPPPPAGPIPLWRFESMVFRNEPERSVVVRPSSGGLNADDLRGSERSLFATPRSPALAPWARVWPKLKEALRTIQSGRDPDIRKLVHAISRGDFVERIPRVPRLAWSPRASLWVDCPPRLLPFFSDIAEVTRRLRRLCSKSGLRVRFMSEPTGARRRGDHGDLVGDGRPDPAAPLLVLSDLGAYGGLDDRAAWLSTGRRLRRSGVRVAALAPVPPGRMDPRLAEQWSVITWESGRTRSRATFRGDPAYWQERAARLLRLISPMVLVQPGLLRSIRRLLPAALVDASTEVDVCSHPDVAAADVSGLVLHPHAAPLWRLEFVRDVDSGLKARVREMIAHWHRDLPLEILRSETLVWHTLLGNSEGAPSPPGDLEDARAFVVRLEETLRRPRGDASFASTVRQFGRLLLSSMPNAAYDVVPALKVVWAASFQGMDGVPVPPGLDPSVLDEVAEPLAKPRYWAVRHEGRSLMIWPLAEGAAWPSQAVGAGSPAAWIFAARSSLWITRGEEQRTQLHLEGERRIPLQPRENVRLESDRCEVNIKRWIRTPQTKAAGRDWHGLWSDVVVNGVVQRFRWIPPGRFRMGSPEGEAGRYDNEGPQRWVTWTKGRWLADTPVTQALWEAVMGSNPSHFKSPDRPVEQVSWDDCHEFIARLNDLVRGLNARLPSEAEWEYACRAGTETATWLGDLVILGDNFAPVLDGIAWYGGNSGQGFELDNGYDSSGWSGKQYPHTRAGTRPVRTRWPNPFGLFDMLGNVYEWCEDSYSEYGAEDVVDPAIVQRSGSSRVFRGGSWSSVARSVRAAVRHALSPDIRYGNLGFRLARGLAPG